MRYLFFLALILSLFSFSAYTQDKLASEFINPPQQARLQAMWFWQGSYFSKEGITKDLEAMKSAGLGAALIMNIGSNTDNNLWPENTYRGVKYWDALKHAAIEANRLGLTIGIANGPGYTGTGGPWIPETKNMRQLAWSHKEVAGNQKIEINLPLPTGHTSGFDSHKRKKPNIYDDIEVLAIPSKKTINLNEIINLTKQMQTNGDLIWDAPAGLWSIYRIGYVPTMEESHPLPDDLFNKTFEVDKLDREANIFHWENVIGPLKQHIGKYYGTSFKVIHIDSYECGTMNWTPRFREEFIKRKGYDPTPWLLTLGTPVLGFKPGQYSGNMMNGLPRDENSKTIDSDEKTNRFDWDFCDVTGRLYNDNILLGRNRMNADQIKFSYEAYAGPFNTAEGMAIADIPMATFWTRNDFDFTASTMNANGVIQSSIAGGSRAAGNKILAAESFTSLPNVSKWTEVPSQLKFIADGALSSGVNQMMLHQWVHQPFDDKFQPGMTNGFWGVHFSRYQTWFEPGKAFFNYINRCQSMLQQGGEVVDCISLDEAQGYTDLISSYNFIHDNSKVVNGQIVLSSGRSYYYLIGPKDGVVLPEVALKLEKLVKAGATIVCSKFSKSPSMKNYPTCDKIVQQISANLWGNAIYKKRVCSTEDEAKANLSLKPDYEVITGNEPKNVRILHRHSANADIYFVVNRSSRPQNLSLSFRIQQKLPELWQAEDLSISDAPVWSSKNGRTTVDVSLSGQQSTFVVFRKTAGQSEHITTIAVSDTSAFWETQTDKLGNPVFHSSKSIVAQIKYSSGKEKTIAFEEDISTPINGGWDVSFVPKLGEKFTMYLPELIDFSKHSSKNVNYFSGTATYRKEIKIDGEMLGPNKQVLVDLGEMNDIATVKVNGNPEVVLWYPPYKTDITKFLNEGNNVLEIAVTNTWVNAVIGDEQIPSDLEHGTCSKKRVGLPVKSLPEWVINNQSRPSARKTFALWDYYYKDSQLQPAGLTGPVRLSISTVVKL